MSAKRNTMVDIGVPLEARAWRDSKSVVLLATSAMNGRMNGRATAKGETFTRVNGDGSFSGSKRLQKC